MTRLHRGALDTLLASIVKGTYKPGELLPKEEDLVEEFGMSRGTVREALRALEERRVVKVKHGSGARVQPFDEWNALDPAVAHALASGRRRRDVAGQSTFVAELLVPAAAALAATHATAAQRTELRTLADGWRGEADVPRLRRLIALASGNRPLAWILQELDDGVQPTIANGDAEAYRRLARAVADGHAGEARDAVLALAA